MGRQALTELQTVYWIDLAAAAILVFSLLLALALGRRGRLSSPRLKSDEVVEVADAELEGERLLQQGRQALSAGDKARAERAFKAAKARLRSAGATLLEAQARYQLALLYWARGQIEQAATTLQPVLDLGSRQAAHYLLLASLDERLGRREESALALQTASKRCGRLPGLQAWMARLNGQAAPSSQTDRHTPIVQLIDRESLDKEMGAALGWLGDETTPALAYLDPDDLARVTGLDGARARQVVDAARRELNLMEKGRH